MFAKQGARVRGLAAELKSLREASGLTTRTAAAKVDMSSATLNRVENGLRLPAFAEVVALLTIYGVRGVERKRIMELAMPDAAEPRWWEMPPPGVFSHHGQALARFEAEAVEMMDSAMLRIPGLLQTPEYLRTLMQIEGAAPETITRVLDIRLCRQAVLRRAAPPRYRAILDEAALRKPVGSGSTMAAQLTHLVDMAAMPHVDVRVVPFDRQHPGAEGDFRIMEFDKATPLVYLEHQCGLSVFLEAEIEVESFRNVAATLSEVALTSSDSAKLMRRLVYEYSRE